MYALRTSVEGIYCAPRRIQPSLGGGVVQAKRCYSILTLGGERLTSDQGCQEFGDVNPNSPRNQLVHLIYFILVLPSALPKQAMESRKGGVQLIK